MGAIKRMLEEIASELGTENIQDSAVMAEGQRRLALLLAREEEEEHRQTEQLLEYFKRGGKVATIPKNTKRTREVFARAQRCRVFTLDNYFRGEDCSVGFAQEQLQRFPFAKLRDNGNGTFTVRLHDNCWYELR